VLKVHVLRKLTIPFTPQRVDERRVLVVDPRVDRLVSEKADGLARVARSGITQVEVITAEHDDDRFTPKRHLPPPGQREHSPQRHTAAGRAAPTATDTGNTVPQRAYICISTFKSRLYRAPARRAHPLEVCIYMYIYLSIYLSIDLSVYMCVYICISIYLSIYLSI